MSEGQAQCDAIQAWRKRDALDAMETPCYVLNPQQAVSDFTRLKEALGTPLIVSLKANPNPDLFARSSQSFVDGIELASLGELNVVVGRSRIPKFVASPSMDAQMMAAGIASRATLVLDSLQQAQALAALESKAAPLPVMLRLNVAALVGDAPGIETDHLGMDIQDAMAAITSLRARSIGIRGLKVFGGSNTLEHSASTIAGAVERLLPEIEQALAAPLECVNLGGGFPVDWTRPQIDLYRQSLSRLSSRTQVWHQAGQAVFARAGLFMTKVVAIKPLNGRHVAVCDGGFAHCAQLSRRGSPSMPGAAVEVMSMGDGVAPAWPTEILLAGNTCSSADIIGSLPSGTRLAVGDRLLYSHCGAYGTLSPPGFLNLKPAQRYLVS